MKITFHILLLLGVPIFFFDLSLAKRQSNL